jgi:hypothetical protein
MSLSSLGDGRLEIGVPRAGASLSGLSLSKECSLSPVSTFERDWEFKSIKTSAVVAEQVQQACRNFVTACVCPINIGTPRGRCCRHRLAMKVPKTISDLQRTSERWIRLS